MLEIWRALANFSYRNQSWYWGGRYESNSVSDAQQLLCLLFPAVNMNGFGLARPDQTDRTVLTWLKSLGTAMEIPVLLMSVLHDYLDRYTVNDTPVFSGGGHFQSARAGATPTPEQQALDVVESYATSLTLMLSTLAFANDFEQVATREDLQLEVARLRERASKRLTAAMVGLLRSFTINTFDADSRPGQALLRTVNQAKLPERRVVEDLRSALTPVAAGLGDISLGSGQKKDLTGVNMLFELGWSWGVIHTTPTIEFAEAAGKQPDGVASDEPYMYFTMVALNSIADLFTAQSLRTDLLDVQQARLARALENRWKMTQLYWSIIASYGGGRRWPLQDVPWRATDEVESDYLTVLVAGASMRNLTDINKAFDPDLDRLGRLLSDLSNRARITRRPTSEDVSQLRLHDPGLELDLVATGDMDGPPLRWPVHDYAAVLLKRAMRLATLFQDRRLHAEMLELADDLWEHLLDRRIPSGHGRDLWDTPNGAYPTLREFSEPSWQMTIRVVESLVIAAELVSTELGPHEQLTMLAEAKLSEAERMLDRELLGGAAQAGPAVRRSIEIVQANLQRAREITVERPGSADALINEALVELDRLVAAREESTWAR
jgi:hypothetical protein